MKLNYDIRSIGEAIESGRSFRSKSAWEQTARAIRQLFRYSAGLHEDVLRGLAHDPAPAKVERELRLLLGCGAFLHRRPVILHALDMLEYGDTTLLALLRALPRDQMPDILERVIRELTAEQDFERD
jgi:hypothetical protein